MHPLSVLDWQGIFYRDVNYGETEENCRKPFAICTAIMYDIL